MKHVDFYAKWKCIKHPRDERFGICDGKPDSEDPAYIDVDKEEDWILTVTNEDKKEVEFVAVDKCVDIIRDDGNMEKRCDCILKYDNNLIFAELKIQNKETWLEGALEEATGKLKTGAVHQLAATIAVYNEFHPVEPTTVQKAYASNKRRPDFNLPYTGAKKRFLVTTGVQLVVNTKIRL